MNGHRVIIIRGNINDRKIGTSRTLSKLETIVWGIFALLGLSIIAALVFVSFVIGLLLLIPIIFLGLLWILSLVLRRKIRLQRSE